MPAERRYIHIRNWDRYQHSDTTRNKETAAPWIKDYTGQLSDSEFLELGFADRGLLESLRLQYAANRGRGMVDSTTNLSRTLGQRVYRSQLERLNDAGFIEISARKLLAARLQPARPDVDVDVDKKPPTPLQEKTEKPAGRKRKTHPCEFCKLELATAGRLAEHLENVHSSRLSNGNGTGSGDLVAVPLDLILDTQPEPEHDPRADWFDE